MTEGNEKVKRLTNVGYCMLKEIKQILMPKVSIINDEKILSDGKILEIALSVLLKTLKKDNKDD